MIKMHMVKLFYLNGGYGDGKFYICFLIFPAQFAFAVTCEMFRALL